MQYTTATRRSTFGSGRWAWKLCGLAALLLAAMAGTVTAEEQAQQQQWSDADFEALFPAPQAGWQSGEVDAQAVTAEVEAAVSGSNGSGTGAPVYITLKRTYTSGNKALRLSIDTSDMRSTNIIDTAWDKENLREQFAANGFYPYQHGGHRGLSFGGRPERGRVIEVGRAGIVMIECGYPDCIEDLDSIVGTLDFTAIEHFVAFDHRR